MRDLWAILYSQKYINTQREMEPLKAVKRAEMLKQWLKVTRELPQQIEKATFLLYWNDKQCQPLELKQCFRLITPPKTGMWMASHHDGQEFLIGLGQSVLQQNQSFGENSLILLDLIYRVKRAKFVICLDNDSVKDTKFTNFQELIKTLTRIMDFQKVQTKSSFKSSFGVLIRYKQAEEKSPTQMFSSTFQKSVKNKGEKFYQLNFPFVKTIQQSLTNNIVQIQINEYDQMGENHGEENKNRFIAKIEELSFCDMATIRFHKYFDSVSNSIKLLSTDSRGNNCDLLYPFAIWDEFFRELIAECSHRFKFKKCRRELQRDYLKGSTFSSQMNVNQNINSHRTEKKIAQLTGAFSKVLQTLFNDQTSQNLSKEEIDFQKHIEIVKILTNECFFCAAERSQILEFFTVGFKAMKIWKPIMRNTDGLKMWLKYPEFISDEKLYDPLEVPIKQLGTTVHYELQYLFRELNKVPLQDQAELYGFINELRQTLNNPRIQGIKKKYAAPYPLENALSQFEEPRLIKEIQQKRTVSKNNFEEVYEAFKSGSMKFKILAVQRLGSLLQQFLNQYKQCQTVHSTDLAAERTSLLMVRMFLFEIPRKIPDIRHSLKFIKSRVEGLAESTPEQRELCEQFWEEYHLFNMGMATVEEFRINLVQDLSEKTENAFLKQVIKEADFEQNNLLHAKFLHHCLLIQEICDDQYFERDQSAEQYIDQRLSLIKQDFEDIYREIVLPSLAENRDLLSL